MALIKSIVDLIDSNIAASQNLQIPKMKLHKFHGLAKLGYETIENNQLKQYPIGLINNEAITYDDRYNLITYHRVIGQKTYTIDNSKAGSNYNYINEVTPMVMVVMANFKKLNLTDDTLEKVFMPHLSSSLLTSAASLGIINGSIYPTSTNYDSLALFNQEYKALQKPFIKSDLVYFQIRYTIESSYKSNCFNNNICGE